MCTIECARCEATFTVSEELCGECDEVLDEVWAERLGANLVAAGLAAEIARLNGASMDGSSCSIDRRVRHFVAVRLGIAGAGES